ncbi:MAG: amidohydrolase family protein [Deltaproteobacteria bacterium]|nr:amidohydrolase family protein [Deltaproteobacteria bacterium]
MTGAALLPSVDGEVGYLHRARIAWSAGRITEIQELSGDPLPGEPLLVPGFVDLHIHWPQAHVRGRFGGALLPWLRESIWPAEAEFASADVALRRAREFVAAAQRAGTCAGLFFGAPFAQASRAFAQVAPAGWLEGPALMERNAPDVLLRPAAELLADLEAHGPPVFAVTPRFAPNLSEAGLAACGAVATERSAPIQSHLSENVDEVAWVRQLFREAADYLDVYDRAGLLGPRTVLAHGIHLSDRELQRLAATGTLIAHCPTSNVALGSGRMPLERLRAAGVPWVLASDVGAGPRLALLDAMAAFIQVHQGFADSTAAEALCRATAIPGQWLHQFDPALAGLGTLAVGAPAHLVALPRLGEGVAGALVGCLAKPSELLETLPSKVWCWGEPVGAAP